VIFFNIRNAFEALKECCSFLNRFETEIELSLLAGIEFINSYAKGHQYKSLLEFLKEFFRVRIT
jgi:hypothetical protein